MINDSEINIKKSLGLHALVLLLMIGYQMKGTDKKSLNLSNTKLVKNSIRVDVVGMPKHTLQELKALSKLSQGGGGEVVETQKEKAPTKVQPPSENDFLKAKKKTSFQDLIKNLSQKKVKVNKQKKSPKKTKKKTSSNSSSPINSKIRNQLKGLILEGNKISKGTSLVGGEATDALESEFNNYILQVPDVVKINWKLPSYLIDKGLQCRIQVFINAAGEVINLKVIESSGNADYDKKAIEAIWRSSLPGPGKEIVYRLIRGDLILGFPL
ncbi:MAG: TonB C-terminal domain-containing protein [Bacteriovoracaceae bacterium]